MSKVSVRHLRELLNHIAAKNGDVTLTKKNLQTIAEEITGIGGDYLYTKIKNPIKKLKDSDSIGLRDDQLDLVAKYVGYATFTDFVKSLSKTTDNQLDSLVGNYYCYVRMNALETVVLRSPIRISKTNDGTFLFELKGKLNVFSGEIENRHGCLFILMRANDGKEFHHVYKIGTRKKPNVLQGIFSGVSTAFDPIGGRVILIHTDESYTSLSNQRINYDSLRKSKDSDEKKLAIYFKEYAKNNLASNKARTFGIDDLSE